MASKDSCDSCNTSSTHNRKEEANCPCKDKFFDDGESPECKGCSFKCATCDKAKAAEDSCLTCKIQANSHRNVEPPCNCMIGYYNDGTDIDCK